MYRQIPITDFHNKHNKTYIYPLINDSPVGQQSYIGTSPTLNCFEEHGARFLATDTYSDVIVDSPPKVKVDMDQFIRVILCVCGLHLSLTSCASHDKYGFIFITIL